MGGDETFFGLPILVLVELASGYIFTEVECENRTYATWSTQIQHWWITAGWECHFMVSDGAPALIKLALSGLGCVSVADLFHALRALARPIGSAIGRQLSRCQTKAQKLQQQYLKTTNQSKGEELKQSLAELQAQQQILSEEQTTYHHALQSITLAIHPFNFLTQQCQLGEELSICLSAPLKQLSLLAQSYGGDKAAQAVNTFEGQIPSIAQGLQAWWQWVKGALALKTKDLYSERVNSGLF